MRTGSLKITVKYLFVFVSLPSSSRLWAQDEESRPLSGDFGFLAVKDLN